MAAMQMMDVSRIIPKMEKRMFQAPKRLGNQIISQPFIPKIKNNLSAPFFRA